MICGPQIKTLATRFCLTPLHTHSQTRAAPSSLFYGAVVREVETRVPGNFCTPAVVSTSCFSPHKDFAPSSLIKGPRVESEGEGHWGGSLGVRGAQAITRLTRVAIEGYRASLHGL